MIERSIPRPARHLSAARLRLRRPRRRRLPGPGARLRPRSRSRRCPRALGFSGAVRDPRLREVANAGRSSGRSRSRRALLRASDAGRIQRGDFMSQPRSGRRFQRRARRSRRTPVRMHIAESLLAGTKRAAHTLCASARLRRLARHSLGEGGRSAIWEGASGPPSPRLRWIDLEHAEGSIGLSLP